MEKRDAIPNDVATGWRSQEVSHDPDDRRPFHYHDVEEWLQVLRGDIRFFTEGEDEYPLRKDDVLRILPGEVHRAEIGPEGVTYRMWTPVA